MVRRPRRYVTSSFTQTTEKLTKNNQENAGHEITLSVVQTIMFVLLLLSLLFCIPCCKEEQAMPHDLLL